LLANAFRAHLAELGIVAPQGIRHVRALIEKVFAEGADAIDLPAQRPETGAQAANRAKRSSA
jgi:hypothetical protein